MRTTIHLPDDLLERAKKAALESGRTLTAVVEEALRESLARRRRAGAATCKVLPIFAGRGLQPGVDLDDSANLLEVMERPDGSS